MRRSQIGQWMRKAASTTMGAGLLSAAQRVHWFQRRWFPTRKDVAGSFFEDRDIPGITIDQDESFTTAGVIIKPESTLVDLWSQTLRCWPVRRFCGVKMWLRGRLGYCWSTYDSVNIEIDAMRHLLFGMGVTKGSRVCVISENRYEWIVVHFATMQLGAQFVAVPTNITPQEAHRIVRATGSRVLFVETIASFNTVKGWIGTCGDLQQVFCFEDHNGPGSYAVAVTVAADIKEKEPICSTIQPEDTACIFFTAGTTGPPKGVMLSHKALVANISSIFAQFGEALSPEDLFVSLCPWGVAGAISIEFYQVMLKGASICIPPELIEGYVDMQTIHPTVVVSVALPWQKAYNNIIDEILRRRSTKQLTRLTIGSITQSRVMLQKPSVAIRAMSSVLLGKFKRQFGRDLRLVVIVGQSLTKDQGELFADLDLFVVNTYGCMEAGGILATDMDVPSKLKTLPGVELRIVNAANEVVVPGDLGEILVETPHSMQGYFNIHVDSEEAARALVLYGNRTFVRTGDFGSLTGGWLTVKGHKDVLITLNDGKVIDPFEVEAMMFKSPFIKQGFVFGDRRPYIVALIVPLTLAISNHLRKVERRDGVPVVNEREKADCIRAELRRVSQSLPPRSHIRRFAFVDEFTLANGMLTCKHNYARQKIETHYVHYINKLYDDTPQFYGFAVDDYDDLF